MLRQNEHKLIVKTDFLEWKTKGKWLRNAFEDLKDKELSFVFHMKHGYQNVLSHVN